MSLEPLVSLAFDLAKTIQREHFETILGFSGLADFIGVLVQFSRNRATPKISLQAVELARLSIDSVVRAVHTNHECVARPSPAALSASDSTSVAASAGSRPSNETVLALQFWFPVYFGLYKMIVLAGLEPRTCALHVLFDSMQAYGSSYPATFWEALFNGVIEPIFEEGAYGERPGDLPAIDPDEWTSTTLVLALKLLAELFGRFFADLEFLLPRLLKLLCDYVKGDLDILSRTGISCLSKLVNQNAGQFTRASWAQVCDAFRELLEMSLPIELLGLPTDGSPSASASASVELLSSMSANGTVNESFDQSYPDTEIPDDTLPANVDLGRGIRKCVLRLRLTECLDELLNASLAVYAALEPDHLMLLYGLVRKAFEFACNFNANSRLRVSLWNQGIVKQMPNMLRQETQAALCCITLLRRISIDPKRVTQHASAIEELLG